METEKGWIRGRLPRNSYTKVGEIAGKKIGMPSISYFHVIKCLSIYPGPCPWKDDTVFMAVVEAAKEVIAETEAKRAEFNSHTLATVPVS